MLFLLVVAHIVAVVTSRKEVSCLEVQLKVNDGLTTNGWPSRDRIVQKIEKTTTSCFGSFKIDGFLFNTIG